MSKLLQILVVPSVGANFGVCFCIKYILKKPFTYCKKCCSYPNVKRASLLFIQWSSYGNNLQSPFQLCTQRCYTGYSLSPDLSNAATVSVSLFEGNMKGRQPTLGKMVLERQDLEILRSNFFKNVRIFHEFFQNYDETSR